MVIRNRKKQLFKRFTSAIIILFLIVNAIWHGFTSREDANALGGLTFSQIGIHPQAAAQATESGKELTDLTIDDGMLYAGYGDYDTNTGPIVINPFDLTGNTFLGSQITLPTEEVMTIKSINGSLYAPMTDPQLAWNVDVGYATNAQGVWENKFIAPAIHMFDMATLDGSDLWIVGTRDTHGAIAYRSTDGGATWNIAQTDQAADTLFERYYWVESLNGKVYMQANGLTPQAPLRVYDGLQWTEGPEGEFCGATDPGLVEVFSNYIVCGAWGTNTLRVFDGTEIETIQIPQSVNVGAIKDFYVHEGYLYILGTLSIARTANMDAWERLALSSSNYHSIAVYDDYFYIGASGGALLRSETTLSSMPEMYIPSGCFDFNGSTGEIIQYFSSVDGVPCDKNVIIPSSIDGVPVQSIGPNAFYSKQLTSVMIPGSVTTIARDAFSFNYDLTEVHIENGLSSIAERAFAYTNLQSITLPASVATVSADAFQNSNLLDLVLLGSPASFSSSALTGNSIRSVRHNGVTYTSPDSPEARDACFTRSTNTITNYHRFDITKLMTTGVACLSSRVSIPQTMSGVTITRLGSSSLYNKGLTEVTLPSTITRIDTFALANNKLQQIALPAGVNTLGTYAFFSNELTSVVLPNALTVIPANSFYLNNITSLTLPSNVTSIGDYAFNNNDITSLTFPGTLTSIGARAFENNKIEAVTFPSSVLSVGQNSFANNSLHSITFQGTPTTIASGVIDGNGSLEQVTHIGTTYTKSTERTVPESCYTTSAGTIVKYKFFDLSLLVKNGVACTSTALDLPASIAGAAITKIGDNSFNALPLTYIALPSTVTEIGYYAFSGTKLQNVVFNDGLLRIQGSAFYGAKLEQVNLPESLESIGDYAFHRNNLQTVQLPSSLETLDIWAFSHNKLRSVTLGGGLTSIGEGVFAMNDLDRLSIPSQIQSIHAAAFFGQNAAGGAIDDYDNEELSWTSEDAATRASHYANLKYVRLELESVTNQYDLNSAYVYEDQWTGEDVSGNGSITDSIGGHIINPSVVTAQYRNAKGVSIKDSISEVGRHAVEGIGSYLVKDGPPLPVSESDWYNQITPEELIAIDAAFANAYYQKGDTVTFEAPHIQNYALPNPKHVTKQLNGTEELVTFVYPEQISSVRFSEKTISNGSASAAVSDTVKVSSIVRTATLDIISQTNGTLTQAALLPASDLQLPSSVESLGGIGFSIQTERGKAVPVTLTLQASNIASSLRIYKKSNGSIRDVTNLITITSQAGQTKLSFTLVDGGELDEDGSANGVIVDPLYIGLYRPAVSPISQPALSYAEDPPPITDEDTPESTPSSNDAPDQRTNDETSIPQGLKENTGFSIVHIVLFSALAIGLIGIVSYVVYRRKRSI